MSQITESPELLRMQADVDAMFPTPPYREVDRLLIRKMVSNAYALGRCEQSALELQRAKARLETMTAIVAPVHEQTEVPNA